MTQEMLQRLVQVREHVDSLETEALRADPQKLDTCADELTNMSQEMHEIYVQNTASFRQLEEEHHAQLGQEDLNALAETLEAAEEAAEVIAALRASGSTNTAKEEKITMFEQDISRMHERTSDLAAAEEEEVYGAE